MRSAFNGLVAVALVSVLTSCSGVVQGDPAPSAGSTGAGDPSRTDTSTGALAPKVVEPLKPEPFVVDACRTVTTGQAGDLDLVTPGRKTSNAASSSCLWRTKDERTTVAVSYLTTLTAGLSELYAQHAKDPTAFKYFEPATVAGYPALYADKARVRESGACMLNIGVTDGLYMKVQVHYMPQGKDVCDLAARAGEAMIATMKKGE